jgi:ferredoxin-NADP reductase
MLPCSHSGIEVRTDTIESVRVLQTRDVIRATPRTRIIRLGLEEEPFAFSAGQAVLVGLHGSALRKPYSSACSPGQATRHRELELLVQIDDGDPDNPHLECLVPGTPVDVDGPLGSFGLPPDAEDDDILFIGGGTGIAPLRSMLWDTIERRPMQHVALIYSARSVDEIAYERELRELADAGRVDVRFTITREGPESWLGPRGRIDAALIQSTIRKLETRCIVCGPPGMISDVTRLLLAAGVGRERIITETFAT